MLIAASDRVTGRRIGSRALAGVDADDRGRHAGVDRQHRKLHHGDRRRPAEREVCCKQRIDPRHMGQLYGVAPVRIVQRLVG